MLQLQIRLEMQVQRRLLMWSGVSPLLWSNFVRCTNLGDKVIPKCKFVECMGLGQRLHLGLNPVLTFAGKGDFFRLAQSDAEARQLRQQQQLLPQ